MAATAEKQTETTRTDEILDAVDAAERARQLWRAQREATLPTEELAEAIEDCVNVITNGDTPHDCQDVTLAAAKLGQAWESYVYDGVHLQGMPRDEVWQAFAEMVSARHGADTYEPRTIETVSEFKEQGLSDDQIAMQYGERRGGDGSIWQGPFHDSTGRVLVGQIRKQHLHEQGKPGGEQIIPDDFVHPRERRKAEQTRRENQRRLERLRQIPEQAPKRREMSEVDKVEYAKQLLLEGQFIGTISHHLGIPEKRLKELADEVGAEVEVGPVVQPDRLESEPDPADAAQQIEERIQELGADGDMAAAEIAEAVGNEFKTRVTPQKVGRVLRGK